MASVTPRKRSRSIEPDTVAHKKPNLAAEPSPMNGVVSESRGNDEPNAHSTLEVVSHYLYMFEMCSSSCKVFRKEAIYRRMRHYARENERQDSRIAELERRKTTCEAGLAAMSACWAQVANILLPLSRTFSLTCFTVHSFCRQYAFSLKQTNCRPQAPSSPVSIFNTRSHRRS